MLFDLSGMAASLKSTSSLFKNSVADTSKLSVKEIEQLKQSLASYSQSAGQKEVL